MSDSEVLIAAFDVIAREGFSSFTFEQVGKVVGLSPAALVKRFKNKNQLALLARNLKWEQNLGQTNPEKFDELSGLDGIFDFLSIISRSVNSNRLGEHAMWLGKEACHPRSKRKVAAYFETTRSIFLRLVMQAIENGQLKNIENAKELARTMEALVQGAVFQFAFLNERDIEIHLKDHLGLC
ncbi:MAG: TetR/AcrR family transcriptional regulator [Bdellovibrionaceae bacterium]|nr:TetR/AcrR family transcriptional regulator [Pseudobdellovibrionaceae bacterium]